MLFAALVGTGLYHGLHLKALEERAEVSRLAFIDGTQHQRPIGVGVGAAVGVAAGCVGLVILAPSCMIYLLIALSLLLMTLVVAFSFIIKGILISVLLLGVLVSYGCMLYCFWADIKLGVLFVSSASLFLKERPLVLLASLIKALFGVVFGFFWGTVFILIALRTKYAEDLPLKSAEIWMAFWFVELYVFAMILHYSLTFTVGTACANWYYGLKDDLGLLKSYKRLFCYQFGSIVFAALVSIVLAPMRLFLDLSGRPEEQKTCISRRCIGLLGCLVRGTPELLQVMNHSAVIMISVTGESFIEGSKTALGLLWDNLSVMASCSIIKKLLMFIGLAVSVGVGSIAGSAATLHVTGDEITREQLLAVIIACGLFYSSLILGLLTESISAVMIMSCIEERYLGLGYPSLHMPSEIRSILKPVEIAKD